jgi:hypothetical protein
VALQKAGGRGRYDGSDGSVQSNAVAGWLVAPGPPSLGPCRTASEKAKRHLWGRVGVGADKPQRIRAAAVPERNAPHRSPPPRGGRGS